MRALTAEDLMPLEEFAGQRRELFGAQVRYVDRYRRVRVGPSASLVFENRQTLWFRVQEVLRVSRLTDPARVQQELNLYNRLLPGPNRLQAALLVQINEHKLAEELAPWLGLQGEDVQLVLGESGYPADLITCRPEDRCCGAAHWVHFPLDPGARSLLADVRTPAHVEIKLPGYAHASPPLGVEIRQSLLDDLNLSDRLAS